MKQRFNDQKSFISYNDFLGGVNVDCGEDGYAKNELSKGKNLDIVSKGKVCTRMGIVPLNSVSYNASVKKYFEWRKKDGTVEAVAVFKHATDPVTYSLERINRLDGTNTTIINIESDDFDFEIFNDKLLFITGGLFRYYDGTSVKNLRQTQPTGTLTVSQTQWVQQYDSENNPIGTRPSNLLDGTYKFKFTTVNSLGAESPSSEITSINAADAEQFTITVPVGDSDTVSRRVYRTKVGGAAAFYLVAQLNDNTTTSVNDSTIDEELSGLLNDTNIHTNLVKCKMLKRHPYSTRFFASGNPDDVSALYVSEANEPWNWQSSLVYYPNSGTGGKILDIRMVGKFVIVFYESGPYAWSGVDPDLDATWGPLTVYQAPSGERLSCLTSNTVTMANSTGFHMINPSLLTSNNIVVQSSEEYVFNLAKDKFTEEFKKITDFSNSKMIFDWVDNKILLYCDDGNGEYRVIVYWWEKHAFTIYTGWKVNEWFQSFNGTLMFCSDNYIFITKRGLNDNGQAIDFEFETGFLDCGFNKILKIISKIFVYCELIGGSTEIIPFVESDTGKKKNLKAIQLYSGTRWSNLFKWDSSSRWGQSAIVSKERRVRTKGIKFKINIKNSNLNEKVILNSIGLGFKNTKPKGERT